MPLATKQLDDSEQMLLNTYSAYMEADSDEDIRALDGATAQKFPPAEYLVGWPTGLEPATSGVTIQCST